MNSREVANDGFTDTRINPFVSQNKTQNYKAELPPLQKKKSCHNYYNSVSLTLAS